MVEIREVTNKKMLKKFIDFPHTLYKDTPQYTPYLYEDEVDNLTPGRNPSSRHCVFKLFLAYKDEKIVGRICAIINNFANKKYNQKRIRFSRIDFIDDEEVSRALIKAVEKFGIENGLNEINGPLGYSDQDKEGMLTKGFEYDNMFATFYTHEYYVRHLEKLGFNVDATWQEYRINIPKEIDPKLLKIADVVEKRYNLHMLKVKHKRELKPYIVKVLRLTNTCYANLYGFVPYEEDQMFHLANQYIPLINLDYLPIVLDKDDNVVAFGIMIPTPVYALKKCNGHLFPFGFIPFLHDLKHQKILDLLLVAVAPEYQNKGVISLVFRDPIKNAIKNNIKYAETGPELETNMQVQAMWKMFDTFNHKARSCFIKPIEEK